MSAEKAGNFETTKRFLLKITPAKQRLKVKKVKKKRKSASNLCLFLSGRATRGALFISQKFISPPLTPQGTGSPGTRSSLPDPCRDIPAITARDKASLSRHVPPLPGAGGAAGCPVPHPPASVVACPRSPLPCDPPGEAGPGPRAGCGPGEPGLSSAGSPGRGCVFLEGLMMTDTQLITSGEPSYFNFQSLSC